MNSIESGKVGREENQPQECGGGNRDEDVPALVEVLGQLPGEESVDGTHQYDE